MKKGTLPILFIIIIQCAMANTYTTRMKGYWHQASTWMNGSVPSYTFSDTVIIRHPVDFKQDIFMNSGAFMRIDSLGGLCGHHNITVYSNAMLYKYGLLQLDTMFVTGGKVILDGPEDATFSRYAIITVTGASLYNKGCKLSVGPWFECTGADYESSVNGVKSKQHTAIYPNPNRGRLYIQFYSPGAVNTLRLINMQGQTVMEQQLNNSALPELIDISSLPAGIYCWQLFMNEQLADSGKLSLMH